MLLSNNVSIYVLGTSMKTHLRVRHRSYLLIFVEFRSELDSQPCVSALRLWARRVHDLVFQFGWLIEEQLTLARAISNMCASVRCVHTQPKSFLISSASKPWPLSFTNPELSKLASSLLENSRRCSLVPDIKSFRFRVCKIMMSGFIHNRHQICR
jgi:hypothetical protein